MIKSRVFIQDSGRIGASGRMVLMLIDAANK